MFHWTKKLQTKVTCTEFHSIIGQWVRQVKTHELHHGKLTGYFPTHLDLDCISAHASRWQMQTYGWTTCTGNLITGVFL